MKKKIVILSFSLLVFYSIKGQTDGNKTKLFLKKWSQKSFNKNSPLDSIDINSVNLDNFHLDSFYVDKIYKKIDINLDGKNDIILLITNRDFNFPIKDPSTSHSRIIIICLNQGSKYILNSFYSKLLNKYNEGLLKLDIFMDSNDLILRESGSWLGTDWATDLMFRYNNKEKFLYLRKAVDYIADVDINGVHLKKAVHIYNANEKIDLVNYYRYFPLGFTDNLTRSRSAPAE